MYFFLSEVKKTTARFLKFFFQMFCVTFTQFLVYVFQEKLVITIFSKGSDLFKFCFETQVRLSSKAKKFQIQMVINTCFRKTDMVLFFF